MYEIEFLFGIVVTEVETVRQVYWVGVCFGMFLGAVLLYLFDSIGEKIRSKIKK